MADDIRVSAPGPNGEKFELNLKERALSLSMKDLVPFLLLALVGALGYYRILTHDARLATIDDHLQRLYAQQEAQRSDLQRSLLSQFDQLREQLRSQSELVTSHSEQIRASLRENRELTGGRMQKQDELLASQTEHLTKNQDSMMEGMRQHMERLRVWFATVLFKLEHADTPVSLDLPLPHPERNR